MKLPITFFLQNIGEKKVYYFSSTQLNIFINHCTIKTNEFAEKSNSINHFTKI